MTLDGLTVAEWLRDHETLRGPELDRPTDVAQDGPPAAWKPRVERAQGILIWCIAVTAGAWLAAPALAAHTTCPPSGEEATYCHLQHNVLAAAMTFLLVAAGVVLVGRMAFGLRRFVTRVRAEGLLPRSPSAAIYGDPLLIAANRGHVG